MADGLVILVDFELKPGTTGAFLPLIEANAAASVRDEPGCRRFDVMTVPGDPVRIVLYEIYDSAAAFDAHLASAHYAAFRDAAEPLIAGRSIRRLDLHEHAKTA